MKIDKEKFKQLSQLDRIEFRQRLNCIKERTLSNLPDFKFVWYIIITSLLMFNLSLSIYGNFGVEYASIIIAMFKVIYFFAVVSFVFIIFTTLWGIGFIVKGIKDEKELIKEYFKIEVKKKK